MPAKFIICAPGRPNTNGHRRRTFTWNPTFNCYVHEKELNAVAEVVFKRNYDIRPFIRITQYSDGAAAGANTDFVPLADHKALQDRYAKLQGRIGETPVTPIATLSAAREVSLDEAVEIVQRLAPEKLRKTSQGRKPAETKAMEVG